MTRGPSSRRSNPRAARRPLTEEPAMDRASCPSYARVGASGFGRRELAIQCFDLFRRDTPLLEDGIQLSFGLLQLGAERSRLTQAFGIGIELWVLERGADGRDLRFERFDALFDVVQVSLSTPEL